jgi:translation initiation factor IF-2
MAKVRIYELAKKLNRNSKDILDELADMGFEGKSHSSSIDESIADKIARTLAAAEPVEPPAPPKEEPKPKPEVL